MRTALKVAHRFLAGQMTVSSSSFALMRRELEAVHGEGG